MKIAPVAEIKSKLSFYLGQCATEGPIVITKNGKAVAMLLCPTDDEDFERLLLSRSPRFQTILKDSRESIYSGKGISSKNFWKQVKQ
jgi:prevent-host-death family protein